MTLAIVALFLIGFRPIGVLDMEISYIWKSLLFIPFTRNGLWEPILSVGWTLNFEMFFIRYLRCCLLCLILDLEYLFW